MSRNPVPVVLAVAAAFLVAACGPSAGAADRPPDGPTPGVIATATASAAPSEPAPAAARLGDPSAEPVATALLPDAGVLPRSVAYGILSWTVTDAAITTQDPAAFAAGSDGPSTPRTSLIVDFEIRNDSPHVGFVTTTSRLVAELADGTIVEGKDLGRPSAAPESTVESRYAFEVPAETTFDDVTLRFEDPGREPSLDLPLSGAAPDVETDLTTRIALTKAVGIPGIDMRWTVDTLLTGRDWPLPIGFKGGTRVSGARAETGHQWVGIVARVDVGHCDCKGGVLDQAGSARLVVDGSPFTAEAADSSEAIMNASTFSDVMLVFDIPAEATHAVLQVGPLEEPDQQAAFDLAID